MSWLKQSTAVTIVMPPMLDSTDGNTPETGLTISQSDIRLSKNGGAYAQTNNVAGATHMEVGNYSVPLDMTDTATLGTLRVSIHESGALAVWREFTIIPANVFDSIVLSTDKLQTDVRQWKGTDVSVPDVAGIPNINITHLRGTYLHPTVAGVLETNITHISDDSTAADNAELAFDGTGYGFTGCTVPTVTTLTGHTAQTGDSFARIGATGSSLTSLAPAATALTDVTWTDIRAGYLNNLSAGAVALAATALTNATWTDAKAGYLTAAVATASALSTMQGNVTDILLDTGTTIPGTITTLQTDSTAIKANTDNLPSGIKKNTAYTAYTFMMVDSTDHVTAKTGLTVAGSYTGDGGAVASLTNTGTITEISNGLYEIDLTSGELNYNNVHLIFTATGANARVIGIHTST